MLNASILNLEESIIGFLLWLDSICFNIFTGLYRSFIKLANQNIFVNGAFDTLISNLYVIIGIIALFLFASMLLKMIVDPNAEKGGKQIVEMIKRFVIATIMIVLVPTFFDFLTDVQSSLLTYNVVPNFILGSSSTTIDMYDEDGNNLGKKEINIQEESALLLQTYANNMTVKLISGLMYPIDENGNIQDDITINASEFFKGSTKAWILGLSCAAGIAVGVVTVGTGAGVAVLACGIGGIGGGLLANGVEAVTASEYTWSYAKAHMIAYGDFSQITLFANAIQQGDMHYSALISTIVAGFLVYMIASFCIDIVIRAAKLALYQLVAPICFLWSVIPKQKELMGKWFKVVITTWGEIFIRVATMCAVVLLVGRIDFDALNISIFHPIISTFVICGVVIFAKQLPKLLSQLTGIDSGNMKLNLREKLSEGGIYAMGGVLLGGAKRLARGVTRNVANHFEQDEHGKWHRKNGVTWRRVIGSGAAGVVKSIPSVISTQFNAGRSGYKAKNFKEMLSGINQANTQAEINGEKIKKYIADHGGTLQGIGMGLLTSGWEAFKGYIGLEPDFSVLKEQKEAVDDIAKILKQIKATSEDYIDKHKSEFYVNLTPDQLAELNYYRKMEKEGDMVEQATARSWLQTFDNTHINNRLDVMEAKAAAIKSSGKNPGESDEAYAARIATATNDFNKARKNIVDAFATDVGVLRNYTDPSSGVVHDIRGHYGAEKEASSILANLGAINDKLEGYSNSAVVRTLRDGTDDGVVVATSGEVTSDNAAKFIKQLKNATEVTDANISRQYEELQRKNKKKTNGGN